MAKRGFSNREVARMAGEKSSRLGIPDKTTKRTREHFQTLVENNLERLQTDLDSLEPKDRIEAIIKLAAFVIPKLASVDIDATLSTNTLPEVVFISKKADSQRIHSQLNRGTAFDDVLEVE